MQGLNLKVSIGEIYNDLNFFLDGTIVYPLEGIKLDTDWPLTIMGNLILPIDTSGLNCSDLKDTLRFLRWSYTNPQAKILVNNVGYYVPSDIILTEVLRYLDNIICNGETLLEVIPIPVSNDAKIAVTVIYWIIILIIIGIIYIFKVDKPIAKIYMFILVVGLILSGSAMVFWTLEPKYDAICTIRWWLMGLGMIIFSGGVFCRSYQF